MSGPDPGAPGDHVVVVVVDGDHVWVDPSGRLPRLRRDEPALADLVPGRTDLIALAPVRTVSVGPVHVLGARSGEPPPAPWSRRPRTEVVDDTAVLAHVEQEVARFAGRATRPAQRAAWYDDCWLEDRLRWVDGVLEARGMRRLDDGRALQTWSLSTVLRIAAAGAPGPGEVSGDVVLKSSCAHFGAEPALTAYVARLCPGLVPEVLATDPASRTMLSRALPPDVRQADDVDLAAFAPILARFQVASVGHRTRLVAVGAPDRSLGKAAQDLRAELGPGDLADRVQGHLASLAGSGLPDTAGHGDLHRGNLAVLGDGSVQVFDWSDTCWTHPALDIAHLTRGIADPDLAVRAWESWAAVWREARGELVLDVEEIRRRADVADQAHHLVTYRTLVPTLEATSGPDAGAATGWLRARLAECPAV